MPFYPSVPQCKVLDIVEATIIYVVFFAMVSLRSRCGIYHDSAKAARTFTALRGVACSNSECYCSLVTVENARGPTLSGLDTVGERNSDRADVIPIDI